MKQGDIAMWNGTDYVPLQTPATSVTYNTLSAPQITTTGNILSGAGMQWHSMGIQPMPRANDRMKDNIWGKDDKSQNLFWDWLVQAGWKQNIIAHDKCDGAVCVMLIHEACGKVIESRMLHALSNKEAEELGSLGYVRKKIREHKAYDKGNGCKKAIPKGEAHEEV